MFPSPILYNPLILMATRGGFLRGKKDYKITFYMFSIICIMATADWNPLGDVYLVTAR